MASTVKKRTIRSWSLQDWILVGSSSRVGDRVSYLLFLHVFHIICARTTQGTLANVKPNLRQWPQAGVVFSAQRSSGFSSERSELSTQHSQPISIPAWLTQFWEQVRSPVQQHLPLLGTCWKEEGAMGRSQSHIWNWSSFPCDFRA